MEVRLPSAGADLDEAEVVRWLVSEGTVVRVGQPLIVVAYDKADVEVPAPVSGVLTELSVNEGDLVRTGGLLALIVEVSQ